VFRGGRAQLKRGRFAASKGENLFLSLKENNRRKPLTQREKNLFPGNQGKDRFSGKGDRKGKAFPAAVRRKRKKKGSSALKRRGDGVGVSEKKRRANRSGRGKESREKTLFVHVYSGKKQKS